MDAPPAFSFQAGYEPAQRDDDADKSAASKGPKRKRLAKACDACHKSKRRCDGTAPCSNCYFASKPCHYTDASGRPVPAPHTGKPDASKAPRNSAVRSKMFAEDGQPDPSTSPDRLDGERRQSRKRVKNDRPNTQETSSDSVVAREDTIKERVAPLVLDNALTRELTNLFFTHLHPVRAVIHKPSFCASLSHSRVPSYLLFAMCALAAPLSRQPRIRSTTPPRLSGRPFAHEAVSQMFDGSGQLLCDPNLFTAQALCLLMTHDLVSKDVGAPANSRYRDLALQIVQALGVHNSEHPVVPPVPTADFIHASIERECMRRIFWIIHVMDLQTSIYTQRPLSLSDAQLRLRLPLDETSFELAVHSTSPEYLYLPPSPVRTHWVSELGHFIRIYSLYVQAEQILNRADTNLSTLSELEKRGEEWVSNLPDHLLFSEQNLQVQQSMFETSSNTGAWCFCCMHVYYVGFILALHAVRNNMTPHSMNSSTPVSQRPQWTVTRLDMIMQMLGDRAKNSMLMGAFIWIQIKYCNRDDAQTRGWSNDYEEMWGTRIPELVAATTASRLAHSFSHASKRLLPPAAPSSQMYPLGRSLDELRLHNHGSNWSNTPHPHLQLGMGSGFGVGSNGDKDGVIMRTKNEADGDSPSKTGGRLGESLPSLKSSGLLDSWGSATAPNTHSRTDMRELTVKPSSGMESDARSTTLSGMPVGLQWLANESR